MLAIAAIKLIMITMAWPPVSLLATAFVLVALLAVSQLTSSSKKPQDRDVRDIDTVGINLMGGKISQRLSRISALLRSLTSTSQWAHDGYRRFSKAQDPRAFALPSMWTGSAMVVLSPSVMACVLNRPEAELAAHRAQLDTIQLPYMMSDSDVYDNPIQFDLVRRNMSRQNVRSLGAPTATELHAAFTAYWESTPNTDTQDNRVNSPDRWTTLNNWDACGKVFTRVAMLSLVGPPLCHDEQLLDWARKYASSVITGTAFINCLPPGWMRSGFGPLFGIQARYFQSRCLRIMVPVIQERIQKHKHQQQQQDGRGVHVAGDFLHSIIFRCARTGDAAQLDPQRIALRLLGLATMSIMGMVYVFTHCIADVYRSPQRQRDELFAALTAECSKQQVAQTDGDDFNPNSNTFHLSVLDSALYESMRLNNISVTSLARDVAADNLYLSIPPALGFDNDNTKSGAAGHGQSDSVHYNLPRGTRVVFPTQDMHRDEKMFGPNPDEFDAFRFSRSSGSDGMCKNLLVFGYGKHVCPGRHYAMQTLRLALSYVVLNYEVELIGQRKEKQTLLNVNVPDIDLRIRVRRRK